MDTFTAEAEYIKGPSKSAEHRATAGSPDDQDKPQVQEPPTAGPGWTQAQTHRCIQRGFTAQFSYHRVIDLAR